MVLLRALLLLCFGLVVACGRSTPQVVLPDGAEVERFTVTPSRLSRGTVGQLELEASTDRLVYGATTLTADVGVTLSEPTVLDSFTLRVLFEVDADAPLGAIDLLLDIDGREIPLPGALSVVDASFTVDPPLAKMGQLLDVTLTGARTAWTPGRTWVDFGPDVRVIDVDVLSSDLLIATLAIASDAPPGARDVAVLEAEGRLAAWRAFTVDREVITAVFDPPQAQRGQLVDFTITGRNVTFPTSMSVADLKFWYEGGPADDIVFTELTWIDPERLSGKAQLSTAAWLGARDLYLRGVEEVLVSDALTVLDRPVAVRDVALATSYNVRRSLDPATGLPSTTVDAFAFFVEPVSPPCGEDAPPVDAPMPFDVPGLFPVPEPRPPSNCPPAPTLSAGEMVWFEGPENIVPMYREVIGATGQIVYRGRGLTLADYRFGTLYGLRVQGDPMGVPAAYIPDVQPTVPADYDVLEPTFAALRHARVDALPLEWTPAQTYPSAIFSLSLGGRLEATGDPYYYGVLPWDDGRYTFGANRLSQLEPGVVTLTAVSATDGPFYSFPGSRWLNRSGTSHTTTAVLTLED